MKKWLYVLFLSVLLIGSGCGGSGSSGSGGSSGGGGGGEVATGTFVDGAIVGLTYTSGSITGTTGEGGTFTYEVGKPVTFKIGDIVIGTATGASIITPLTLVKEANPAISDAAAKEQALKIVQFLLSLNDSTDYSTVYITEEVVAKAKEPGMAAVNLIQGDIGSLISQLKAGASPVSLETAQSHFDLSLENLDVAKFAGEYVTAVYHNDSVAYIFVAQDGSIIGLANNLDGDIDIISGDIEADGTVNAEVRGYSYPEEVLKTIEGKSETPGIITVTPEIDGKIVSIEFRRVTSATNPYRGVFKGTFSGSNEGIWAFAVDLNGDLVGWAEDDNEGFALRGKVNTETGDLTLGVVQDGSTFTGKIEGLDTVSGTWTAKGGGSGTFEGGKLWDDLLPQ